MADDESSVAVRIAEHGKEIGSLKHRVKNVELEVKVITNLAMSVERLAMSVETLAKEQSKHGEKIASLEAEPAKKWNSMMKTIFNTIVGAIAGAVATGVIYAMAQTVIK